MAQTVLTICRDAEALAEIVAARFADAAEEAISERGRFAVGLSGGSTPRRRVRPPRHREVSDRIAWDSVHVFWGDERCIPLAQPDNHFTMATALFLSKVPIPASNVHRARGEASDTDAATRAYEQDLNRFFALGPGEVPRFDLLIQGMGADGHTASIFPGTTACDEVDRLAIAHYVPKLAKDRITLTLPVLNAAREVMFLVAGPEKAPALAEVLAGAEHLPAARVRPMNGVVRWIVDEAAAAALPDDVTTTGSQRR